MPSLCAACILYGPRLVQWWIVAPSTSVWAVPAFTRSEVDRAGRLLAQNGVADPLAIGHALDVINNWRSSHSFPLNTFQMTLRNRAGSICERPIVARRLKRVPSIYAKLRRFPTMKLSQMQDIGGARVVLPSLPEVDALRDLYRHRAKHRFAGEKDYVRNPKTSGYRSIHLVYRYRSDRKETYNGLHVELQLRTRRQHAWATAVETVGTFLGQSLKSSEGREDWLRFFELVGSGFALAEGAPAGPNVPAARTELVTEIRDAAMRLQVRQKLEAFRRVLAVTEKHREEMRGQNYLLLLVLRPEQESLEVRTYVGSRVVAATEDYLLEEKRLAGTAGDTVLVATDSLDSLRQAFPNYFFDTRTFLEELDQLLA